MFDYLTIIPNLKDFNSNLKDMVRESMEIGFENFPKI